MDDRLKRIKLSMKNSTFKDLAFTDEHRSAVHKKIETQYKSDEDLILAVMQLLAAEKTGYQLLQLLTGRGIGNFENNEGSLYTLLHRLEQKGIAEASWSGEKIKHYRLSDRGRKLLRRQEKKLSVKRVSLKELWEG